MASSTELSATSQTRWCRPSSPVEPMYIAGRLRTASRPPRTLMEVASYLCPVTLAGVFSFSPILALLLVFESGRRSRGKISPTLALPIGSAAIANVELGSKGFCFIPRHSADPVARGEGFCGPLQAIFRRLNLSLLQRVLARTRKVQTQSCPDLNRKLEVKRTQIAQKECSEISHKNKHNP